MVLSALAWTEEKLPELEPEPELELEVPPELEPEELPTVAPPITCMSLTPRRWPMM